MRLTNTTENAPISARYECRVKVAYHSDLMGLIEEWMILAVKNFRSKLHDAKTKRYTLLIISRIWPDHYGLKAISDQTYYPMQFEIIEQSVSDWDTDDKSTMMIQIGAIPVNYDLKVNQDDGKYEYIKGFSYPLIGDEVYVLNQNTVRQMYNQKVLDKMHWNNITMNETIFAIAQKNPAIGTIKMFENSEQFLSE